MHLGMTHSPAAAIGFGFNRRDIVRRSLPPPLIHFFIETIVAIGGHCTAGTAQISAASGYLAFALLMSLMICCAIASTCS